MKRIVWVILAALALLTTAALAEGEAAVLPAAEAYTWESLATVAGATAATLLIVQYLKMPLDRVWKIPTRALVYVVALLILLGATAFTRGLTAADAPLLAVNAFVVALAAYGSYELTFGRKA